MYDEITNLLKSTRDTVLSLSIVLTVYGIVERLFMPKQTKIIVDDGVPAELTLKEFELLRILMKNKNAVLTRDNLLESIWGYDCAGETRTVDVHIKTLRTKLRECGALVETVRGIGYKIG